MGVPRTTATSNVIGIFPNIFFLAMARLCHGASCLVLANGGTFERWFRLSTVAACELECVVLLVVVRKEGSIHCDGRCQIFLRRGGEGRNESRSSDRCVSFLRHNFKTTNRAPSINGRTVSLAYPSQNDGRRQKRLLPQQAHAMAG